VNVPRRTCVGCRSARSKSDLIRVVADQAGRLRVDPFQQAPGRGAYLCPDQACIADALRRGGLSRHLRRRRAAIDLGRLSQTVVQDLTAAGAVLFGQGLGDGRVRSSELRRGVSAGTVLLEGPAATTLERDLRFIRRIRWLAKQVCRLQAMVQCEKGGAPPWIDWAMTGGLNDQQQ
jgi:predicted RNA-binding protein YlxR (DUF448 family)